MTILQLAGTAEFPMRNSRPAETDPNGSGHDVAFLEPPFASQGRSEAGTAVMIRRQSGTTISAEL